MNPEVGHCQRSPDREENVDGFSLLDCLPSLNRHNLPIDIVQGHRIISWRFSPLVIQACVSLTVQERYLHNDEVHSYLLVVKNAPSPIPSIPSISQAITDVEAWD